MIAYFLKFDFLVLCNKWQVTKCYFVNIICLVDQFSELKSGENGHHQCYCWPSMLVVDCRFKKVNYKLCNWKWNEWMVCGNLICTFFTFFESKKISNDCWMMPFIQCCTCFRETSYSAGINQNLPDLYLNDGYFIVSLFNDIGLIKVIIIIIA